MPLTGFTNFLYSSAQSFYITSSKKVFAISGLYCLDLWRSINVSVVQLLGRIQRLLMYIASSSIRVCILKSLSLLMLVMILLNALLMLVHIGHADKYCSIRDLCLMDFTRFKLHFTFQVDISGEQHSMINIVIRGPD